MQECLRLRRALVQPISDKTLGPLTTDTIASTKYPLVLLLGNHSSGKSAFINHVLGRRVQESGVAPTDDGFTIIGPGPEDSDRAGPALIGEPDLGFSALKNFGPTLVHKTQLKIRKNTKVKDFMIVDSPGMIDSPVKVNANDEERIMDRGYDFESVCRWYGERADLILLFFDPDKPGTTGETLRVLTNALLAFDHKLHIILNKADQFKQISDYARAYGSLCWNLSKVIPRKDLPQIHTMCLPPSARVDTQVHTDDGSTSGSQVGDRLLAHTASSGAKVSPLRPAVAASSPQKSRFENTNGIMGGTPMRDPVTPFGRPPGKDDEATFLRDGGETLDAARGEVEAEVFRAPARRVDNEISRLSDSVQALTMHCRVLHVATSEYKSALWRWRYTTIGVTTAVVSVCGVLGLSLWRNDVPVIAPANTSSSSSSSSAGPLVVHSRRSAAEAFAAVSTMGSMGLGALFWLQQRSLDALAASLTTYEALTERFRSTYSTQLARGDKFVESLWGSVGSHMSMSITPRQLQSLSPIDSHDFVSLERILEYDIANLRRSTSTRFASPQAMSTSALPSRSDRSPPRPHQSPGQRITYSNIRSSNSSEELGAGANAGKANVTFREDRNPVLLSSPPPLEALLDQVDKQERSNSKDSKQDDDEGLEH